MVSFSTVMCMVLTSSKGGPPPFEKSLQDLLPFRSHNDQPLQGDGSVEEHPADS